MSTFVVRFVGEPQETFRGRVKHVGTGEEATFTNVRELLAFFDGMNAMSHLETTSDDLVEAETTTEVPVGSSEDADGLSGTESDVERNQQNGG